MERLLEMVNSLTPYEVTMENTVVADPSESIGKTNTTVLLKGALSTGTYGERVFNYNRINLSYLSTRQIVWSNENNLQQLLDKINIEPIFTYTLGYGEEAFSRQGFLKPTDIVNETFTKIAGQDLALKIKANPLSYLFLGELSITIIG